MCPLDDDQQSSYDAAVTCRNCNTKFAYDNPKTRHHCHVTGIYLFPANNCNLASKPRKSNWYGEYLVPIILHNMSAYDGHFLLHGFRRKYAEYRLQNNQARYADTKIIPLNSEKYLQFQTENLLFLDSFQFMAATLDTSDCNYMPKNIRLPLEHLYEASTIMRIKAVVACPCSWDVDINADTDWVSR